MTDLVVIAPSALHGVGCFAICRIPADTNLGLARTITPANPDPDEPDVIWRSPKLGRRMNHSDPANVRIEVEVHHRIAFWHAVTCRDVEAGEELTIDYSTMDRP